MLGRAREADGDATIFLGIESLDDADLKSCSKRQNRASEYADAVARLHDRGICVMAGFISGFDDQSADGIVRTAGRLHALGIDVPFLSILTPFRGTPLYDEQLAAGRILEDRDWAHYNGYNVAFRPARMTPAKLLAAHRVQWRAAFAPRAVAERLARGVRQLRPGALLLSAAMNGFYGHKRLTGNEPATAPPSPARIAPASGSAPKLLEQVMRVLRPPRYRDRDHLLLELAPVRIARRDPQTAGQRRRFTPRNPRRERDHAARLRPQRGPYLPWRRIVRDARRLPGANASGAYSLSSKPGAGSMVSVTSHARPRTRTASSSNRAPTSFNTRTIPWTGSPGATRPSTPRAPSGAPCSSPSATPPVTGVT